MGSVQWKGPVGDGLQLCEGCKSIVRLGLAAPSNADSIDENDLLIRDVPKLPLELCHEGACEVIIVRLTNHQVRVRSLESHAEIHIRVDHGLGDTLAVNLCDDSGLQVFSAKQQSFRGLAAVDLGCRGGELVGELSQIHAVRREDTRVFVDDDGLDAEEASHVASVLATGATKHGKTMGGGFIATGLR